MTRAEKARREMKVHEFSEAELRHYLRSGRVLLDCWFQYLRAMEIDIDEPDDGERVAWTIAEQAYWEGAHDVLAALLVASDVLTAEEGADYFDRLRKEVEQVQQRQALLRANCGAPQ